MIKLDEIEKQLATDRGHVVPSATILALIAEVRALRNVCAAAYQLAGTMNAPLRFLDALSDASNGEIEARAKTDDLLPVSPDEVGSFLSDEGQEYREDAERWRTEMELRNDPTVAIMFAGTNNRCCIYRGGVLIAPGSTYAEAIDTARRIGK